MRTWAMVLCGVLAMTLTTKAGDEKSAPAAKGGELKAVITTDKGEMHIQLYPEDAPLTVANFCNLAQRGFYDGLKFHRVVPDFVIQGGDPDGNGRGGPGYKFKDEISSKKHDGPGILSMANAGPGTNGSQFFVTHKATPHLDGKHTVFGKVTQGQDVVMKISKDDVMKSVKIIGDTTALFEANKAQLDEWNKILDAKYPKKGAAAPTPGK